MEFIVSRDLNPAYFSLGMPASNPAAGTPDAAAGRFFAGGPPSVPVGNSAKLAVFSTDSSGLVVAWSEAARLSTGFAPAEILGRPFSVFCPGFEQLLSKPPLAPNDELPELSAKGVAKSGTVLELRFFPVLTTAERPRPSGYTVVLQPVDTRAASEPVVSEPAAIPQQLLLDSVEGFAAFLVAPGGKILSWNRSVQRILGYAEPEFVGRPLTMLLTPEDRAAGTLEQWLQQAESAGRVVGECVHVRKDGTRISAVCVLNALRDESGRLLGFSKVIRDDTERRRAQEAVRLAREELEQRVVERTVELSQAVDLLEQQLIEREHLESALLDAAENERERLGQDLHDGVCQQLTGTAMLTRILASNLTRRNAPEAAQAHHIVELIRSAVEEARDLAKGLHPVSIHSKKGLVVALEELADRARLLVPCRLETPPGVELPPTVALHLYRIAQEAVNNSIKHSGATGIALTLSLNSEELTLCVSDNGCGIRTETADCAGMGMLNLQYRARAIGAKLSIEPNEPSGTTVRCTVPAARLAKFPADRTPEPPVLQTRA